MIPKEQSLSLTGLFLFITLVCARRDYSVQTYGLGLYRVFLFISPLDCFHALVKLFAGKTERFTVFAIAEHEKIQEFIKMVLQLPG